MCRMRTPRVLLLLLGSAALVIVAGLPKVGKSTFVYGMLGALTADEGGHFIGLPARRVSVLLLTEEPPATVEEKADRFGLDDELVYVLSKRRIRADLLQPGGKLGLQLCDRWSVSREAKGELAPADIRGVAEVADRRVGMIVQPVQKLLDMGYEAGLISKKVTVEFVR